MKFLIHIQLGSIPIEGRIEKLMVKAPDEATAKAIAKSKARDMFARTFGAGNPILSKNLNVVLCESRDDDTDVAFERFEAMGRKFEGGDK